jgi:hypothetical protein
MPAVEVCMAEGQTPKDLFPGTAEIQEAESKEDPLSGVAPAVGTEVESYIEILGARVTHVLPCDAPDPGIPRDAAGSWDEWVRRELNRVFDRGRVARADGSLEEISSARPYGMSIGIARGL